MIYPRAYSKETFFDLFKFIRSATKEQLQRYGHPAGLYFLARDMEAHGGPAHPEQLYLFVKNKQWLQYLVGERASDISWQPKYINLNISEIDAVCNFLKESYHKDREQLFNIYGSKAGCVFLAQKLKISPRRLSSLLSTEVLTAIIDICPELAKHLEFERRFNPHPVRLTLKQVRVVLEFLRSAYKADAEAFLEKYGSRFGIVYLARDLVAGGACKQITLDGLSSILRDGEIVFQLCRPFPLSPFFFQKNPDFPTQKKETPTFPPKTSENRDASLRSRIGFPTQKILSRFPAADNHIDKKTILLRFLPFFRTV